MAFRRRKTYCPVVSTSFNSLVSFCSVAAAETVQPNCQTGSFHSFVFGTSVTRATAIGRAGGHVLGAVPTGTHNATSYAPDKEGEKEKAVTRKEGMREKRWMLRARVGTCACGETKQFA